MLDAAFYNQFMNEFKKIALAKYPDFAKDEQWCWDIFERRVLRIKTDSKSQESKLNWEELVENRIKQIAEKCERSEEKFWAYLRKTIRNALRDEFRSPQHALKFKMVSLEQHDKDRENDLSKLDPSLVAIAEKIFPKLRENLKVISLTFIEGKTLVESAKVLNTSKSTAQRMREIEYENLKAEVTDTVGHLDDEEWLQVLRYLFSLLKKEMD